MARHRSRPPQRRRSLRDRCCRACIPLVICCQMPLTDSGRAKPVLHQHPAIVAHCVERVVRETRRPSVRHAIPYVVCPPGHQARASPAVTTQTPIRPSSSTMYTSVGAQLRHIEPHHGTAAWSWNHPHSGRSPRAHKPGGGSCSTPAGQDTPGPAHQPDGVREVNSATQPGKLRKVTQHTLSPRTHGKGRLTRVG
jgi:hypothetical protein